ncbi:hypothetical protein JQ633_31075 [Bradyrhizobium tropiciagri]|uniref:DUF5801 repeats-in-toxin domain-containing protein n=1 Tax=Bradyrhizobium tropiciagri TaxID=312253 RepID=UPI001BA6EFA8|nr:DUF5801 repeats-in-toxin domain-containing protein [Bradyrhizobium tropiciagri]MBR0874835.1 hypothetical protein [Bradyrhizobium tropiciagri]
MALDILAQDLVVDETTGLQDDDTSATNATVTYLLGLDAAGGLASPQVAFQSDFVVASASAGETITTLVLTQNSSGTPFSTTVGVNSNIKTVDGNYVWLFQDATHANVVIGVIGTSNPATAPAATGALAFSFALITTSASHADLYTVQYVPLLHPDATNPDDRIDLTDKVFASVAATTVFNFSQLGDAPPGHNNWYILDADVAAAQKILVTAHDTGVQSEVNVSTQGLGVSSQDVRFGRELQIDLISGGTQSAGKNFTNAPSAPDYTAHLENVSSAGFSISQSTPTNTKADIEIHAYNNDDNAKGAAFPGDDNDTEINITGATFKLNGVATTAAALGITVDISGTGLILRNVGEGVTVDFTTAGGAGGTFDRFTIKNIDGDKDYFDVKEVHFASDTPSAYSEEVGSFINFDDDGPTISTTGTEPTLTVDDSTLATNDTKSFAANFSSAYGADGAGTLTYALSVVAGASGLVDTATNQAVNLSLNGAVVEGRTAVSNDLVFTVSVDATGNVTLDQIRAVVHPNTNDPDDSKTLTSDDLVKLTATITDRDGDHQAATLNIGQNLIFKDDGPTISTTGTEPTLTVDDSTLATNDAKSFAANFSAAYGADGAGTLTYALSVVAGASGLVDTATNQAVNLSLNGAVVEGRTAVSNVLVFTVSVDASGNVTLDQIRAVVHPNTNDPDDSKTLTSDDLVKLTATITDKDGDHQAATLNIGQNLNFKDDGPTISTTGTEPTLTVDDSTLATNDTKSFAANFSSAYGADGAGTQTYALSVVAGASGLVDTATNQAVNLSLNGTVVEGRTAVSNDLVFTVSVDASGNVTLDQIRAVVHPNTNDPDDSKTLTSDDLVKLTATITDKDGDHQAATLNIGQNLNFKDDGPSISTTGTEATATADETDLTTNPTANFASNFNAAYGADGAGTTTYALTMVSGASGLTDTLTGEAINLSLNGTVVEGRTAVTNALAFTVSVDTAGVVTLDQQRAVVHDPNNGPNDTETLTADNLVKLTATITDKDGDQQAATLNIGQNLIFTDDAPTITAPFDGDPSTPNIQENETLGNSAGATASGTFGYDIGHDSRPASFYNATHSDFVDSNASLAGVQIDLTGTVDNSQNPSITSAVATLTSESATSATFGFSFHYDKDPITAGVQDGTAGGTLVFDKVADTYTITLTDPIDGFSFDVLHTSELLAKQPTGNTGHPLIVAEQLTANADPNPFFVQFTANSVTQQVGFGFNPTGDGAPVGDTTFNNGGATHDMITNVNEDWVSATQATNGVAGDTIQKGEALTLRFFKENILGDVNPNAPGGGTERVDPTTSASGVVIKFDGIGNSEDLVLVLDLKNGNGNEITRAINVQNSDLIKGNANVPFPYNTEFTLDNNDALLIIEQNDYTVAGETYQIQGIQIMQSSNGLTGDAINLNGATGANGGSSATSGLTAWDPTDNDVLKIVDIGFVQQTSGTIDANLDFAFKVADADGDATALQHIVVGVLNA